jgi:hypothetical protein
MSYETSNTNWNDLEIQSFKIINELENLYLEQFETLSSNFMESIRNWIYKDESGLNLLEISNKIYDSYNSDSIYNYSLNNYKKIEGTNNSIQIILFEALSVLGINNYNKTYITYAINRLLHEA